MITFECVSDTGAENNTEAVVSRWIRVIFDKDDNGLQKWGR